MTEAPSALMGRALMLVALGRGKASPGPAVGCVIARGEEVVGEGYYTGPPGSPHAEVIALRQAGAAARGATAYVTLEPCSHHGRTPPCTGALIEAGVGRVVYAIIDPDARVSGSGKAALAAAGVAVAEGDGAAESARLLEAYIKHRRTGLPFVVVKYAASLDGRIAAASGDSRWVSGPETRRWAHAMRTQIDAILVGASTVVVDDPQLTARPEAPSAGSGQAPSAGWPSGRPAFGPGQVPSAGSGQVVEVERQPLRVVLDSGGRIGPEAHVLNDVAKTLVATTARSSETWRATIEATGAEVLVLPADDGTGRVGLPALLAHLGKRDVLTLLIEGGGVVHGSFFDAGLVDKVHAVLAPIVIGAVEAATAVAGLGALRMADAVRLRDITVERLGEDVLVTGYPVWPEQAQG